MTNPWVIVTGATGGIGSALVAQLAVAGFCPVIGYRSNAPAAAELAARHNGEAVPLDLRNIAEVDAAIERFSGEDVAALILNASAPPDIVAFSKAMPQSFDLQFQSVIGHHRLLAGIIKKVFQPRRSGTVIAVLSSAMGTSQSAAMQKMPSYVVG